MDDFGGSLQSVAGARTAGKSPTLTLAGEQKKLVGTKFRFGDYFSKLFACCSCLSGPILLLMHRSPNIITKLPSLVIRTFLNAIFDTMDNDQFTFQDFSSRKRGVETGANHGRHQGVSHVLGNPGLGVLAGLRVAG